LHDIPAFGAPVELLWRQRRYRCLEPACPVGRFSEDHPLAGPRAKLTTRAVWWAISCIQRYTALVAAVARRLGVDWHTVWDAIAPLLAELADDPDRLAGIDTLGVDEHIWHHQPRPGKGPKELTGIVNLTRRNGRPEALLWDIAELIQQIPSATLEEIEVSTNRSRFAYRNPAIEVVNTLEEEEQPTLPVWHID
jgi:hypothetical protein